MFKCGIVKKFLLESEICVDIRKMYMKNQQQVERRRFDVQFSIFLCALEKGILIQHDK